jgi:hypothetical protein
VSYIGKQPDVVAVPGNSSITNAQVAGNAAIEATKLGFTQSGTGAVARTVESKLREVASVIDFGASPSNSAAANNNAFTLAFAALNANQIKTLIIPAGYYSVSSTFTLTAQGASVIGQGGRVSVIRQTANVDTFVVSRVDPDNANADIGRIGDVFLADFGIDQGGVANPTAGIALTLRRPQRSQFKGIDIRNCFRGLLIEAAIDCHFAESTIASYAWPLVQPSSYLVRIARYVGTNVTELSSEVFFTSVNWKGSNVTVDNALIIEAGDGIWFTGGHIGFAWDKTVFFNAQNSTVASIINIYFTGIYFDGNLVNNNAGGAVVIAGSNTPAVRELVLNGCTFNNYYNQHCLFVDGRRVNGLIVDGCTFVNNARCAILLVAASGNELTEATITGNVFRNNNNGNTSSSCILLDYCNKVLITGNIIVGETYPHPWGVSIGSNAQNILVSNNIISGCNGTVANNTPTTSKVFDLLNPAGLVPSLASATTLPPIPLGYPVINVTGTNTIQNIDGSSVTTGTSITFLFSDTATVLDGGSLKLSGNFTATAGSTLTLLKMTSEWNEISRAIV